MELFNILNSDRKPGIIFFVITLALCSLPALIQAEQERDPFFSAGPRSTVITTPAPASRENGWGRDPFSHPFGGKIPPRNDQDGAVPVRGKILTGIIFSADVRVAIIGGEALSEGSMVGDQKLSEIHLNSVVLINSAGVREEIFLEDVPIRK